MMEIMPFPLSLSIPSQTSFKLLLNPLLNFSTFRTLCYKQSQHPNTNTNTNIPKKKRKPKPSFYDQISHKWSHNPLSLTHQPLPWHQQQQKHEKDPIFDVQTPFHLVGSPQSSHLESNLGLGSGFRGKFRNTHLEVESKCEVNDEKNEVGLVNGVTFDDLVGSQSSYLESGLHSRDKFRNTHFEFESNCELNNEKNDVDLVDGVNFDDLGIVDEVECSDSLEGDVERVRCTQTLPLCDIGRETISKRPRNKKNEVGLVETNEVSVRRVRGTHTLPLPDVDREIASERPLNRENGVGLVESHEVNVGIVRCKETLPLSDAGREIVFERPQTREKKIDAIKSTQFTSMERVVDSLPWMMEGNEEDGKRSKTALAEKTIPEHELKRLRNLASRMKERVKVGAAGVTQVLVDDIHEKWKIDEVVKLKFEGPPSFNMKRIHDVLESKTRGLVIFRSGTSVVLYRGLSYGLTSVQNYVSENGVNINILRDSDKSFPDRVKLPKDLSKEELMEVSELNNILDELGPRYKDWSGCPPPPVDADLLPGVVPGYRTPFRSLPYGARRCLRDAETTHLRRLARNMSPHFALGRSRDLQGLAAAMVKLWQRSAIAKIAIKRGVLNTNNERMAEQLKRLTGGTLLSRNKEYIVFYRGNDFLSPSVTDVLQERERMITLQHQEEEARLHASAMINSNSRNYKRTPMVAGTLAETVAATSQWGKQPNAEEVDKMLKDSAVARHASLVRYLEKKLSMAKGKMKKAERGLAKVQENLEPTELPTDLETITDEERLIYRKMGLSMKPYLLLGRREVFDGTIENMHLHWKFREVVKIIVKENKLPQVKHIAVALEAESGGILVCIEKTTKGYTIILYRGKNYQRPLKLKPQNLLTKRQALARSIELQRREALKHHIASLEEQIELLKSNLEDMKDGKEIDDKTFYRILDDPSIPSDDETEEEDEEGYMQTYDDGDENSFV